jgi:very-short-patch-repair endonuclease
MSASQAELLLAQQLRQAGVPFESEFRFAPPRRWRFDFAMPYAWTAIEVEGGSYIGGHKRGKAYESDCDKHNTATQMGWRVYRFTPAHVNDGRALATIKAAFHLEEAA